MNSPSKQPEPPAFFLDRSLGKIRIATALRQAGAIAHIHDDYFPSNAKDEDWLTVFDFEAKVVAETKSRLRLGHNLTQLYNNAFPK